jgi:uncharacterized protein
MIDPDYKQGEFCWYELGTRDVGAAADFYTALFGWTAEDMPMPGDQGIYTMLRLGGGDIGGLYEMRGPQFEGVPPNWLSYIWVDDVAATAAQVEALGGKVITAPMEVPGVALMAVIADPNGAVFALYRGITHPGAARLGNVQGAIAWLELVTPDTAKAERFYTALLGWQARADDSTGMPYTLFMVGETQVAGMMAMEGDEWAGIPPHWMPYFAVADCAAAADRAEALGGQVRVPPTEIPGVGPFAVIVDPTGGVFSIITLGEPDADM